MTAIKLEGKRKLTFTALQFYGMLGAAWSPFGIAADAGIGGYKYWQSNSGKSVEEYRPDDPEEVE